MNIDRLWKMGLACVAAVVVMAGTSLVMAAPVLYEIAPLNDATSTETASEGHAITPDGKYVAVAVSGSTTTGAGAIWDAVSGTQRVRDVPGNLSHNATGIGYITVAGSQRLVVHAAAEGPKDCYWISSDGGATWGRYKPAVNDPPASIPIVSTGTSNTLAGSGSGGTFYGACDETSLKFWGVKGMGDAPTFIGSGKSTTQEAHTKGVASASPVPGIEFRVVGYRKDDNGNARNYVMDYDGTGLSSPTNWFPLGLQGNTLGQLWAINADTGTRAGGYSPHSSKTGLWPFICDNPVADGGTAIELPTFNPSAGNANNGIVYGLSPDGNYAVGMDYTLGVEKAVLWDISDPDSGKWTEVDLTYYASYNSILGDFTSLRRAYSVGVTDEGLPAITGWGVTTGLLTRGYVLYYDSSVPVLNPGDANGDLVVNDEDASILGAHWLMQSGATWAMGDFNADKKVDDKDAAILAAHWSTGVREASVPEPGTLVLLASAAAALWFRRRWS